MPHPGPPEAELAAGAEAWGELEGGGDHGVAMLHLRGRSVNAQSGAGMLATRLALAAVLARALPLAAAFCLLFDVRVELRAGDDTVTVGVRAGEAAQHGVRGFDAGHLAVAVRINPLEAQVAASRIQLRHGLELLARGQLVAVRVQLFEEHRWHLRLLQGQAPIAILVERLETLSELLLPHHARTIIGLLRADLVVLVRVELVKVLLPRGFGLRARDLTVLVRVEPLEKARGHRLR